MRGQGTGDRRRGLVLLFLTFLLSLAPCPLRAQHALILIQHDDAGPHPPPEAFISSEWILWPTEQPSLNNRILSLAAGVDLAAEPGDLGFESAGYGAFRPRNGRSLAARGFFEARKAYLGDLPTIAVGPGHGAAGPNVLLLALSDPAKPVEVRDAPGPGLVVAEARGWDDAAALASKVTGRTLVVEYPPEEGKGWSRYWFRGGDWPGGLPTERGLGVPGLVRGRSALALLLRPSTFDWRPNDSGRWGGANRWLEHGRETAPWALFAWFLGAAFVLVWALAQVMNEDRGPFVSEVLVLLVLSPATIVLAGAGGRLGGLEAWPIVTVLAGLALYLLASVGSLIARRREPEAHPLWAASLVGLAAMVLCDPLWSDFSGRFGPMDLDVPGEALGGLAAYLAGAVAFAPGRWFGRALVATLLLWGTTANPWWIGGHAALLALPACALIAAEGLFRPLLFLALFPAGALRAVREGAWWNPGGLLARAGEAGSVNLWQGFTLFLSPACLGTLAFLAVGLLVGNRFLAYRLRKLLRLDPRLRVFPWVAGSALALGLVEPLALPAVPVVALGTMAVLAYDGLRANA